MAFSQSWRPHEKSTSQNPTYERLLGSTELGFYWDSVFERTADTLQIAEIEVRSTESEIIGHSDVVRTWAGLKQQFPMLGAQLEERGEDQIFFVVAENNLRKCRPAEITFQEIGSAEEASDLASKFVVDYRLLSNDHLARIFVLKRNDRPDWFHIIFHVSHCITDGMANSTILRTFLDRLSRKSPTEVWNLTQRLSLSVASEDLVPQRHFPVAKRRWRSAIAFVIASRRTSRLSGGHTLPRKFSQTTPYTPAHSKRTHCSFSIETSTNIISNCRKNKLTFGNAYPVLAQVALTRVLIRRYLRGEISEEEWEFRKKEPMLTAGPLNLRPFLDKDWLEQGGTTNVSLSISFFMYSMPFMPLGSSAHLRPGMDVPSYDTLLSKNRFLFRSHSLRAKATQYIRHPLFIELAEAQTPRRLDRLRGAGLQWRKEKRAPQHLSAKLLSPMEQATEGLVLANGGSSIGNMDHLVPQDYPLSKDAKTATLHLSSSGTMLHCRPSELYLGAATSRQQLHLNVFWDNNVFDEGVVIEWLEEVKEATNFYLGQEEAQARL
ncbi:hypothetical protein B0H34DRAFT_320922 [Crassisporium funariophilum]|nr:hypothetical protein B0H34DRAFT_320922 [Crassisporium funariophilum]